MTIDYHRPDADAPQLLACPLSRRTIAEGAAALWHAGFGRGGDLGAFPAFDGREQIASFLEGSHT